MQLCVRALRTSIGNTISLTWEPHHNLCPWAQEPCLSSSLPLQSWPEICCRHTCYHTTSWGVWISWLDLRPDLHPYFYLTVTRALMGPVAVTIPAPHPQLRCGGTVHRQ